MSLHRFVYYSAVIGGWAALLAWLVCEALFLRSHWLKEAVDAALSRGSYEIRGIGGLLEVLLTGTAVGAAIGAGINVVSGMTNARWKRQMQRVVPGLLGGGVGGAAGALLGAAMYWLGLPRAIGWMLMGLGIGASDGLYERSRRKLRNGLIGGVIGGLIGGLLFDLINYLAPASLETFSRATALVILGLSIGAMIGLAQVVLKEAWLTVVDGYRPGRQLILSQTVTTLGRGDHLPLPFLGYSGKDLESEHSRINRQEDGTYVAQDNGSRIGTRVNGQLIQGPTSLADGDLLRIGSNIVKFNHRHRGKEHGLAEGAVQAGIAAPGAMPTPPPPVGVAIPGPGGVFAPPGGGAAMPPAASTGLAGVTPPPVPYGETPVAPPPRPGTSWLPPKSPSAPPARPSQPPRIPPPPPPRG